MSLSASNITHVLSTSYLDFHQGPQGVRGPRGEKVNTSSASPILFFFFNVHSFLHIHVNVCDFAPELSTHVKWWIKLESHSLLSMLFPGRRRAARWQRREGVCIWKAERAPAHSLTHCLLCIVVRLWMTQRMEGRLKKTRLWRVPWKRNTWIHTIVMRCC